jgi:small subunit ribosomal protein S20
MRQTERRTARNRATRSAVRTYVKKAAVAVVETSADATELVRQAVRALDKAAKRGIIHPNAAARRKSRLMSRVHALSTAAAGEAAAPTRPARKAAAPKKTTATVRKAPAKKAESAPAKSTSTTRRKPVAKKDS